MAIERGQIWMMDGGARLPEGRAVLVIQAQALLDAEHPTTLVVPLSTNTVADAAPLRVRIPAIGKLKRETDAMIDQLRPVDVRLLIKGPLAKVSAALLDSVGEAVRDVLDVAS
jgi:mRNA interferase MazF